MTQFDEQYQDVIREIMNNGIDIYSERQNCYTKAIPGVVFSLDKGFPLLTLRKIPIKLFVAEQIWFLMGESDHKVFLNKFTHIWDDFVEEDGKVYSAYGYRWRHHFGKDQIKGVIDLLIKEPSSRQGVVTAWDPSMDMYGLGKKKMNVPCPYTFTANIMGNMLNLHLIIRSNDMILGCPHDIAGFALLQRFLASKLEVKVGKLTCSISHAHIYENHFEGAWELLDRTNNHKEIELYHRPGWFDRAEKGDEELAKEIIDTLSSQYNPSESIKNLKIVL